MVSFEAIKRQKIGATPENFIEDIFTELCTDSVYILKREEFEGIPAPGTFAQPTFKVFNTYTERTVAHFSGSTGNFCNENDFRPIFKEIERRIQLAIEERIKEKG